MVEMDSIRAHNEEASEYDEQVRNYRSHSHDVLFGLVFVVVVVLPEVRIVFNLFQAATRRSEA